MTHTGYKIYESGAADAFLGRGRKFALVIGDQNCDAKASGSLYEQFYLLAPNLSGYWAPGGLDAAASAPINGTTNDTTNLHLGVMIEQWVRPEQPNVTSAQAGLFYDSAHQDGDGTGGTGNVGDQSGGGYTAASAHELIWPQSGATTASGQNICSFALRSYGSDRDDWYERELTASVIVHTPIALSGTFPIVVGPSLSVGARRGVGSYAIGGDVLSAVTPGTLTAMETTIAAGSGVPTVAIFATAATNYGRRCIVSGAMIRTSDGDGLDMMVAGTPNMTMGDPDPAINFNYDSHAAVRNAQAIRDPTIIVWVLGQNIERQNSPGCAFDTLYEEPSENTNEGLWSEIFTDIIHTVRSQLGEPPTTGVVPNLICTPVFSGQCDNPDDWAAASANIVRQARAQCDYGNRFASVTPEKWKTNRTATLDLGHLATATEVLTATGDGQIIQTPITVFRGAKTTGTYAVGDGVIDTTNAVYTFGNHRYFRCKVAHTNQPTTSTTHWEHVDFRWTQYFAAVVASYIFAEVQYSFSSLRRDRVSLRSRASRIPGLG